MLLAIFGINNTALNVVVTLVILMLVAIWIAMIVFTFTDARRRISDPFLVGCATAAAFFPFVGTLVYTILRPPEFLDDVRERETEIQESEVRLRHLQHNSCHKCGSPVESDFIRCPACRSRLKEPCPTCSKPVGLNWKVCPYCEATLIAPKRSSRSGSKRPKSSSSTSGRAQPRPDRDSANPEERRRRPKPKTDGVPQGNKPDGSNRRSSKASDKTEASPRTSRSPRRKISVDDDQTETINRGED